MKKEKGGNLAELEGSRRRIRREEQQIEKNLGQREEWAAEETGKGPGGAMCRKNLNGRAARPISFKKRGAHGVTIKGLRSVPGYGKKFRRGKE